MKDSKEEEACENKNEEKKEIVDKTVKKREGRCK